ncbi:inosine/xanthosine triphosphatase [Candidatus Nomurabacteria bacterium]|nr:inosine/xanthosine triphosphatase [Candidatus Nomurabacteria bacterium]
MKTIAVGSLNPIKIEAAKKAFEQTFPQETFEAVGHAADSEVSDQPMSSRETLLGGRNRVRNTRAAAPDADYYVGLEGGLEEIEGKLIEVGWMVVENQSGKESIARTASLTLPEEIAQIVKNGKELGHAVDEVYKKENSKQSTGLVGILTQGRIMRSDFYVHTLVLALAVFVPIKKSNP